MHNWTHLILLFSWYFTLPATLKGWWQCSVTLTVDFEISHTKWCSSNCKFYISHKEGGHYCSEVLWWQL